MYASPSRRRGIGEKVPDNDSKGKKTIRGNRIFVTGGAGFIGSALIGRLVNDNKITVYDSLKRNSLITKSYANHPNLTIIQGDILDLALLKESMKGSNIVVHAAAVAGIAETIKNPVNTLITNMTGTANALEAASAISGLDRFVDFSTSEVFGVQAENVTETTPAAIGPAGVARWTYSVSKLAGEHLTMAYHNYYQLPTVTVRPFNVYGPGQVGEGAIQIFIRRALEDQPLYIFGDGSQIRAWCYISDFLDALQVCLISPDAVGEVFNIGNSRTVINTLNLAHSICRILNSKSKIVFRDALSADIELRSPKLDKMHKILGVRAKVDLEQGITLFADWIKNHRSELPELSPIFSSGAA